MVRNLLFTMRFVLLAMESKLWEITVHEIIIIHTKLSKINTNVAFRKRVVWCHWWPAHWTHTFPQHLTGGIFAYFLQHALPALLEDISLLTRRRMYTSCTTKHLLISVGSSGSIRISSSHTEGLAVAVLELATTVTGSEPVKLTCVRLHKIYGVCSQSSHFSFTVANRIHP
jgi:hypothetical protein